MPRTGLIRKGGGGGRGPLPRGGCFKGLGKGVVVGGVVSAAGASRAAEGDDGGAAECDRERRPRVA